MGQDFIVDKLTALLSRDGLTLEECHVVYILVEIRKLIDKDRPMLLKAFPLLKFYADWSVHTEKGYVTPEIAAAAEQVYAFSLKRIKERYPSLSETSPLEAFAHGHDLRSELASFLHRHGMPSGIADHGWLNFVECLIRVLEDQPILRPTNDITRMYFSPASKRSVLFTVEFAREVEGHPSITYGNVLY